MVKILTAASTIGLLLVSFTSYSRLGGCGTETVEEGADPSLLSWGGSGGDGRWSSSPLRRRSGQEIDMDINRHIRKRSGEGWTVWDGKSVLHQEAGSTCNWREFKAAGISPGNHGNGSGPQAPSFMCLYPRNQDIYVTGEIESYGRWTNCDVITTRLRTGGKETTTPGAAAAQQPTYYVDIGANIGSCVMQVLLTTDAHVIAFEPTPKNLFHLTSTLLNLPQDLKDRVTLFPIALGDETTVSTVMTNPTNAGNTQLKRSSNEKGADGATVEAHNIPVERIDDLFGPDLSVDLIKMDVQGFECFVVDGMKGLLERTRTVMFEVEKNLYQRFVGDDACHGARLVKTLQLSNFDVTSAAGVKIADLTVKSGHELKKVEFPFQDMFGEKKRK